MLFAQPAEHKMTPDQYIENYRDEAIREMLLNGIPASITLAQGMLESGNGNSDLAVYANNHFGIKCHSGWNGPTFIKDDDTRDECFRKYPSVLDSYSDHSHFLRSRSRYASLFELRQTDYKGWAKGLKKAGYATDPNYAPRLIALIERYQLHEYDKQKGLPNLTVKEKKPEKPSELSTIAIQRDHLVKFIVVRPGDSFLRIAKETDKDIWQLYKYNDLDKTHVLQPGQRLYLQPKRRKAKEQTHVLKKGETLWSVSQQHCVRLKKLYKYNGLRPGQDPATGTSINLRPAE